MRTGERPVCARCGELLGVYEPLIVIDGSGVRRTSLAAEPELAIRHGGNGCLHAACAPLPDPGRRSLSAVDTTPLRASPSRGEPSTPTPDGSPVDP
jgi:hypothetical protein